MASADAQGVALGSMSLYCTTYTHPLSRVRCGPAAGGGAGPAKVDGERLFAGLTKKPTTRARWEVQLGIPMPCC